MSPWTRVRRMLGSKKDSTNPLIRWPIGALRSLDRGLRQARRLVTDPDARTVTFLRVFKGRSVHQTTPLTWMDRYPEIFGACRDHTGDRPDLRILSYGCSTGEEVVTLREYFPTARIVGAEINPRSLAVCRAREVDDAIAFVASDSTAFRSQSPFDLVFCMAVLQRTPHMVAESGMKSLDRLYPFGKFDQQVAELDRWVVPGGLLIVHHTQYVFTDSSVADSYSVLPNHPEPTVEGPRFDRNSLLIDHPVATPSIYVKRQTDHC